MRDDAAVQAVFNPWALNLFTHLLEGATRVLLSCHARPDGDAIGSMVGLGLVLKTLGKEVTCLSPNGVPAAYSWIEDGGVLGVFDDDPEGFRTEAASYDLCISLDYNALSRVDPQLCAILERIEAPRVMIDHHDYPSSEFDLYFSYPPASSTAELVYEFVQRLWGKECLTRPIATALYMGLMTDTGSFSYSVDRPRTFEVGGALVERGADVPDIQSHVYGSFSEGRMRLYGFALYSRMKIIAGGKAAIIPLTRFSLDEYGYQAGDTEGLVNEPLKIAGVLVSVMLTEKKTGNVRVSIRSRFGVEVHRLAMRYFNGGGHPKASGGQLKMDLRTATKYTQEVVERFLQNGEQPQSPE